MLVEYSVVDKKKTYSAVLPCRDFADAQRKAERWTNDAVGNTEWHPVKFTETTSLLENGFFAFRCSDIEGGEFCTITIEHMDHLRSTMNYAIEQSQIAALEGRFYSFQIVPLEISSGE